MKVRWPDLHCWSPTLEPGQGLGLVGENLATWPCPEGTTCDHSPVEPPPVGELKRGRCKVVCGSGRHVTGGLQWNPTDL